MKSNWISAILVLIVWFIAACEDEILMFELPQQLAFEVYTPAHDLASTQKLDKHDKYYVLLKELLATEQTGWKKNYASYVTGPFIFRGKNLIIRCYPDALIIDSTEGGVPTSIRKEIPNILQRLGLDR
jgi:hypothetical protein